MEAGTAVELWGLPPDVPEELLTLYFESRRRSGGGPVRGWQRLGRGGILTFQEPEDAARVLAQAEHRLLGARLGLRPAPPRAAARLLLQGLPAGTAPARLEQHVRGLLGAAGLPEQPCRALASPRPDRALVQLAAPLSEAAFAALAAAARARGLDGAPVSVAWVPQARAVRAVAEAGAAPVDPLLLELYLENERHSGGGPLEGVRGARGARGAVAVFRQWQAAERVLRREHRLQGARLSLVPHYDVLEPEELAEDAAPDGPAPQGPPQARGQAEPLDAAPSGASPRTEPAGSPEPALRDGPGPGGSPAREGPPSPGAMGSPAGRGAARPAPVEPAGRVGPGGGPAGAGEESPGPGAPLGPEDPAELVLTMEPEALRFLQLYHQDLLASLGDVALFPLEDMDVAGFRLCGAQAPCQAAQELLQSLLGGLSRYVLRLKLPGSARFLRGGEGGRLLRGLEARFQCVFGTERLAGAAPDTDPEEADPDEALWVLPGHSHAPRPALRSWESTSVEEVGEWLATLEDWLPLEVGEEECEEDSVSPSPRAPGQLEEEAALQLALHRSLEPQGQAAQRAEAAMLRQALALSLLEPPASEPPEPLDGASDGRTQLVVHAPFEQDMEELERALVTALEGHLAEETVGAPGPGLPAELRARLERYYGVSVASRGDCTVLRGFGAQPARAARHVAALLAGPWEPGVALPPAASDTAAPAPRPQGPLGALEALAQSSEEFQQVVQAFYDTLDTAQNRVHIVRVERVRHPLLEQQYQLHRERLSRRCQRPAERVLYHGTTASAVPDICAYGFNRSFCGRNGALYGQGVYFARRASLSVLDRYSPPDARGHKAVFVARVLTGDYGQGQRGLRVPPPRAAGHALPRYDSAVDCVQDPRIFVVFHDTQALPTHLITCRQGPPPAPGSPPRPAPDT
ncbi:protein mono-ADP-ribosyltransferase PARP10 [Perognathus longimembris pacificus]|uniref:protein mono-ADP-ribosyltransferase PARP10 n=1 Tax=Perognathus longimembris pacificus TaxID=214514 RepID=UPI0020195227|nr:protein mono-ADP-ribosyltransferase PARP10 [Perognathus longimembris pacificus]